MVDADKDVWIIDADSWQLEGYPCPVGTPMFTAPSALGKPYSDSLRTMDEELFAVATMLLTILITGQFPYARAGSDGDIARLIKDGNFAFQYRENSNGDQPNGNWKYMWSHLQPVRQGDVLAHLPPRRGPVRQAPERRGMAQGIPGLQTLAGQR